MSDTAAVDLKIVPIPALLELQAIPNWVGAMLKKRDGTDDKAPRDVSKPAFAATSHPMADSTDPKTWTDYSTAVANQGGLDVLGFVFADGGGLTGVDFDHCIKDGATEPWALEQVRKLGSYTEVSVSGDGYHVILRGTLKAGHNVFNRDGERCKVECYSAGRYFTVSSNHAPGMPTSLCDRQTALDDLTAELWPPPPLSPPPSSPPPSSSSTSSYHPTWQVWDVAIKAKPVIGELRAGGFGGKPTPSEAVGKLLFELAWFTQDAAQIATMFEDSQLYGDGDGQWDAKKWSRRRSEEIGDALAAQAGKAYDWTHIDHPRTIAPLGTPPSLTADADDEPERPFGITAREWAAQVPEEPEWVWESYIARGDLVELDGAAKRAGKSTLIWHLVKAMETGADYLGGATTEGDVVVLSEMAGGTLREQLGGAGILGSEHLHLILYNEWSRESWESITDRAIAKCTEVGAVLLVVDTLTKWGKIRGTEGNNEGDWLERMEHLEPLHGSRTAVVALCHDRKSGGSVGESGAGSTARTGAMDTVLRLSRIDGGESSKQRKLEAIGRHPDTPDSQIISLTTEGYVTLGSKPDAVRHKLEDEIKKVMADGADWTLAGLTTALDGTRSTTMRALGTLVEIHWCYKTAGNAKTAATYRAAKIHVKPGTKTDRSTKLIDLMSTPGVQP